MALFAVEITRTICVTADDEASAHELAIKHEGDEDAEPDSIWASEIKSPSDIPDGWNDAYPYGDDGTLTCEEMVKTFEVHP